MVGVFHLNIIESETELKELLRTQKTASRKERIQLLYLLKTKKAKTITQASEILARNRVTLQDWLNKYRHGGLSKMLERKTSPGRPRKIPPWAEDALAKRLEDPQGFESYHEICQWLEGKLGLKANYKTVHSLVYYRLKASPKIARPQSLEQSEERLEAFKKTLSKT